MVYMKLGRPWEERVESLWDNQTSYSEAMLSHLLYCLSLDIDFFCARHEKILPPVFMCAGCVSLECLAVPAHSALKVLVFLSWVAQNNGMMLGISSLLLYSSCPAYQKVWVVYLSIFLSCIALMGKT